MAEPPLLEAHDLRVDYGDLTAVDGVSLTLEPGQVLGLVGPNGAGKTSTIRVLTTLMDPTYGSVRIGGHDIFEEPAKARRLIGFMPDLAPVNPDLRVGEFIELYDRAYGLEPRDRAFRVRRALREVGLEEKRETRASDLSRGMTQRLVLAKTLLHEPPVLILDEPASGMDPLARRDLRDLLKAQAAEGRAVLVSSHILTELADMCTHVAVMHRGRLRAIGSVDEIARRFSAGAVCPVKLRTLGDPGAARAWLEGREGVSELVVKEQRLRFLLAGDETAAAGLLAAMVAEGFALVGFEVERASLEDVLTELHRDEDPSDGR
jgi:ABC-2 type transport system ATP-binding protein